MAHPDTDPAYPEYQPETPEPETGAPGGAEVPESTPFNGDPFDGRTHDVGGEPLTGSAD